MFADVCAFKKHIPKKIDNKNTHTKKIKYCKRNHNTLVMRVGGEYYEGGTWYMDSIYYAINGMYKDNGNYVLYKQCVIILWFLPYFFFIVILPLFFCVCFSFVSKCITNQKKYVCMKTNRN